VLPKAVSIVVAVALAAGGVYVAYALLAGDVNITQEMAAEVPTMLFGLGAVALAREPRGVIYDIVNRQRLRQIHQAERREEDRQLHDQVLAQVAS
jgi:hypothetical protein